MNVLTISASILLTVVVVDCAIVFPDEISTIAGIVYSLLPPIKIGQDSRVGVGFRVGPSADAQVLLELGPQSNTAPLGDNTSKRQTRTQRPSYTPAEREQLLRTLLERMRRMIGSEAKRTPDKKESP